MWTPDSPTATAVHFALKGAFDLQGVAMLVGLLATAQLALIGWKFARMLNGRHNISKNCETTR